MTVQQLHGLTTLPEKNQILWKYSQVHTGFIVNEEKKFYDPCAMLAWLEVEIREHR